MSKIIGKMQITFLVQVNTEIHYPAGFGVMVAFKTPTVVEIVFRRALINSRVD